MPARKLRVRCWDLRQQPQHGGFSLYDLDSLPRERVQGLMCKNCFQIFTDSIPGVRMGDNRLNRCAQKAQHLAHPHSTLPDPDDPEPEEESPLGAGGERRRSARQKQRRITCEREISY
jgi:hypothetical protein